MGLDNPSHIAILVVVLLLVFGARRLPEIGRSLGSGMREFKESITGESKPTLGAGQQAHTPVSQPQQPVSAAPPVPPAQPQPPPAQPQPPPVQPQPPPAQPVAAQPGAAGEQQPNPFGG
jgi:sec-independent protein translocase protein TatA